MKIFLNFFFYVNILFTIILFSCGDNVKLNKDDLDKYPWMKTFTYGIINFKGLYHNIDLGNFSFSFNSKYQKKVFFNEVDTNATREGWGILKRDDNLRIYIRPSEVYSKENYFDKIKLYYEMNSDIINFEFEISESNRTSP